MKGFILALLCVAPLCQAYDEAKCRADVAGQFAYYKLAISLAREWCIANAKPNDAQCSREYVVHGLWPQCQNGYPADCRLANPAQQDRLDLARVKRFMPSDFLIRHEWEKHGSCTGQRRSEYFATTEQLFNKLVLPRLQPGLYSVADLTTQIATANPGMPRESIELACDEDASKPGARGDTLDEIRICFSPAGAFSACRQVERSCPAGKKINVRR